MTMEPKDQSGLKRILNTVHTGFSNVQSSIQSSIQRQGNSTFYTATIQQKKSLKCGWLKKQGGVVKSWHRRWFTIKGDHMYYFSSDDETKMLGYIYLPGNRVVECPFNSSEPDKFLFEIQPGGEKPRMTSTHETYPIAAVSDDERKDWVRVIRRVMYAERGGAIFGQALEDTMRYELQFNRKIPQIVEMCIEYLTHHGLETEGIFRLPGRTSVIRQLRELFDCGERPDLFSPAFEADFNTVASLLKQYLRELPEPLIPPSFYEPVMKAVIRDMPTDREQGLESLSSILREIPSVNYNLLQHLCKFLSQVSLKSDQNKMTDNNLATVFAQCIIKPEDEDPALLMGTAGNRTQVVLVLIRHHRFIFKMEYTIDGSSIVVDNLLDFTTSENNNISAATESYFPVSKSSSLEHDLLGLDLGPTASQEVLQTPIHPSVSQEQINVTHNGNSTDPVVHMKQNEFVERSHETFYSVSSELEDEEFLDYEEEEEEEEPVFGSSRASRLQGDAQSETVPGNAKAESAKRLSGEVNTVMMRGNSKKSPVPPPRPSKHKTPESRSSSDDLTHISDGPVVAHTTLAENKRIESFLEVDLDSLSYDELRVFSESLMGELKTQRSKVSELHNMVSTLKQTHKVQVHKMAEKISHEREATTCAVAKVMELQSQIEEYQLRHSTQLD